MKIKENYNSIEKAYNTPSYKPYYEYSNIPYKNNLYENFFTAYALRGAMVDKPDAGRAGLPVIHPISGPVSEPSPLNTRWQYDPQNTSITGIL
jgi:hypothetical protein